MKNCLRTIYVEFEHVIVSIDISTQKLGGKNAYLLFADPNIIVSNPNLNADISTEIILVRPAVVEFLDCKKRPLHRLLL